MPKGGGTYKVGQPYKLNGRTYYPTENPSYSAEGIASWYGRDFHGKSTANGEIYDMRAITAAHPTLPIPSYARVTNLQNNYSIVVRINDRGPYARNRLIDLSSGAARALGFYDHGLTRVRVDYIGRAPIEGSDDEMLMATLRNGSPAPAPANVAMGTNPFLPRPNDGGARVAQTPANSSTTVPPGRPISLGSENSGATPSAGPGPGTRTAAKTPPPAATAPERAQPKSVVTLRVKPRSDELPAPAAGTGNAEPTPPPGYAPTRMDGSLGLMSGRGLY